MVPCRPDGTELTDIHDHLPYPAIGFGHAGHGIVGYHIHEFVFYLQHRGSALVYCRQRSGHAAHDGQSICGYRCDADDLVVYLEQHAGRQTRKDLGYCNGCGCGRHGIRQAGHSPGIQSQRGQFGHRAERHGDDFAHVIRIRIWVCRFGDDRAGIKILVACGFILKLKIDRRLIRQIHPDDNECRYFKRRIGTTLYPEIHGDG